MSTQDPVPKRLERLLPRPTAEGASVTGNASVLARVKPPSNGVPTQPARLSKLPRPTAARAPTLLERPVA